jgi:hypothetical protein
VVPYDIRELLRFQKGVPEQVDVHGVTFTTWKPQIGHATFVTGP